MSRGIVALGPLHDLLPEWVAVVLALWTQLGDVWFLAVLLGLVYWLSPTDRVEVATLAGVALAGLAFGRFLKGLLALPRPTEPLTRSEALPGLLQPLYEATGTAAGYGFPSLHAMLATIVYLGLARRLAVGSARRRWSVALLLAGTVALTRVALGVHYLVDVLAGALLGLAFLLGVEWLLPRLRSARPTVGFGLAGGFAAVTLALGPITLDGILLLGAALGLFAGWQLVVRGRRLRSRVGPHSEGGRQLLVRAVLAGVAMGPLLVALAVSPVGSAPSAAALLGLGLLVFVTLSTAWHSPSAGRAADAIRSWALALLRNFRRRVSRVVASVRDEGPS